MREQPGDQPPISKIATPADEATLYNRSSPLIALNEIAEKTGSSRDEFAHGKSGRAASKTDSKRA